MRLLLCGGTGFIGSALSDELLRRGDEVCIVTRMKPSADLESSGSGRHPKLQYATWNEWAQDPGRWDGFDAVVNLTGETISQRWTGGAKRRIVGSRVSAADKVAGILGTMSSPPPVVVNASGISLYGHSGDAVFDESSPARPADFLGDTIMEWEAAADRIPARRLVKLRIGLVLARKGGAFPMLRLPYRLFAGGRMGSGGQGMPWIHLQDMVGLILLSLDHPEVSGPLNCTAPAPVTNDEFGRMLGKVTHRPHWFPVPGFLLKTVLGEMSTLVLTGQKALPRKALDHGYRFVYPELEDALRDVTR